MGNKKKSSTKKSVVYDELLYMNDKEVTAKDISDSIKSNKYEADLWDELGIVSFKLIDDTYIDLVEIETDLGTDEGNKYVSDNNIKSIFTVKVPRESLEDAQNVMKEVVNNIGGLFCMDNEEFKEVIK